MNAIGKSSWFYRKNMKKLSIINRKLEDRGNMENIEIEHMRKVLEKRCIVLKNETLPLGVTGIYSNGM